MMAVAAGAPSGSAGSSWPALPLDQWEDTRATLHMWMQIVGKTRLALAPLQNHWWQVAFYLTPRGLTTSPMPHGARTLEIEFDFLAHRLAARTSDGGNATLPLVPQSVADFYERYLALLTAIECPVRIWPHPSEVPNAIAFARDRVHAAYDGDAARRFWRILLQVERVLQAFRGRFVGKCSPIHFWWGGLDLAHTRFSGRPAPRHPGGIPNMPDAVTREAYSHECISVGWWPGGGAAPVLEPSFYAYAYPEPPGCPDAVVRPEAARFDPVLREWLLPYEAVRAARDPGAMVLDFVQSTYEAASVLAGWDRAALERSSGS